MLSTSLHKATVKLQRFWCGNIPFVAYELPSGEIAMSATQSLPAYSRVLAKIATNLIAENHLPAITAILPNHSTLTLHPLVPTVIALWSHFKHIGKLPSERKKLLNELLAETPILKESQLLLSKAKDFRIEVAQSPITLAKILKLEIEAFSLQAFLFEDNIYIPDSSGLSIINAPISWIIELNPAQKKARILKKNGFSFKEQILFFQENSLFQICARTWSDWLILWEYFARNGNSKAFAVLRYLASRGLQSYKIAQRQQQFVQICTNR